MEIPSINYFLTFFFCGYLIDFALFLTENNHINPWVEMLLGVVLCTQGSAFIIMASFGIRAMDLLAICLHERTQKPFWLYKGIFEAALLITGYFLGGDIGFGTLLFLVFVGWFIQPTILINQKLGVVNFSSIK